MSNKKKFNKLLATTSLLAMAAGGVTEALANSDQPNTTYSALTNQNFYTAVFVGQPETSDVNHWLLATDNTLTATGITPTDVPEDGASLNIGPGPLLGGGVGRDGSGIIFNESKLTYVSEISNLGANLNNLRIVNSVRIGNVRAEGVTLSADNDPVITPADPLENLNGGLIIFDADAEVTLTGGDRLYFDAPADYTGLWHPNSLSSVFNANGKNAIITFDTRMDIGGGEREPTPIVLETAFSHPGGVNAVLNINTDVYVGAERWSQAGTINIGTINDPATFTISANGGSNEILLGIAGTSSSGVTQVINFINPDSVLHIVNGDDAQAYDPGVVGDGADSRNIEFNNGFKLAGASDLQGNLTLEAIDANKMVCMLDTPGDGSSIGINAEHRLASTTLTGAADIAFVSELKIFAQNINIDMSEPTTRSNPEFRAAVLLPELDTGKDGVVNIMSPDTGVVLGGNANSKFVFDSTGGRISIPGSVAVMGDIITNTDKENSVEFEGEVTAVTGVVGAGANRLQEVILRQTVPLTLVGGADYPYEISGVGINACNLFVTEDIDITITGTEPLGNAGDVIEVESLASTITIEPGSIVNSAIAATQSGANIDVLVNGTVNGDITGVSTISFPGTAGNTAYLNSANLGADDVYFAGSSVNVGSATVVSGNLHVGTNSAGVVVGSDTTLYNSVTVNGNVSFAGTNNINLIFNDAGQGQYIANDGLDYASDTVLNIAINDAGISSITPGYKIEVVSNQGTLNSSTTPEVNFVQGSNNQFPWNVSLDSKGSIIFEAGNPLATTVPVVAGSYVIRELDNQTESSEGYVLDRIEDSQVFESFAGTALRGEASGDESAMYGAWVSSFIGGAKQRVTSDDSGYRSNRYGVHLGADYKLNEDLIAGAALSYAENNIKHRDQKQGDNAELKSYLFTLYGLHNISDEWFVDAAMSFGKHEINTKDRRLENGATVVAKGEYDAFTFGTAAKVGYKLSMCGYDIMPLVGLSYSYVGDTSFTESNTQFKRNVRTKSSNRFVGSLGAKVAMHGVELAEGFKLAPELHGSVNHDFIGKQTRQSVSTQNIINTVEVRGRKRERTTFVVGTNFNAEYGMMEYGLGYDYRVANKYQSHEGSLTVRVNF